MSEQDKLSDVINDQMQVMPVLPLRDVVVYPFMVIPLFVGREKSIQALEKAMDESKQILLVAQKNASQDEPEIEDLYRIGTIANILQLLKLPDGTIKVLVEGSERAKIINFIGTEEYFNAQISTVESSQAGGEDRESEVLMRSVMAQFDQYVKLSKKVPPEILSSLSSIDEPGRLADTIAAHMSLKIDEK
jgi:ATP-dependent Lon protease